MRLKQIIALSLCLLAGCNMLNLEKEEPEHDSFQPVFTAEINGEPFSGNGFAGTTDIQQYNWLSIFGDEYDKEFFPYKERISFAITYKEGKKKYSSAPMTIIIEGGTDARTGGRYRESDGDAPISKYEALPDGDGYITVHMDTLEDGRVVASGTFQMTVAKQYRHNQYSRRETDTLQITNGKYRLLLEDEREEE